MAYSATDFRKNIYRILDEILAKGEPAEIERKGHRLRVSPVDEIPPSKRLRPLPGLIVGDPAALEHVDWSAEWRP